MHLINGVCECVMEQPLLDDKWRESLNELILLSEAKKGIWARRFFLPAFPVWGWYWWRPSRDIGDVLLANAFSSFFISALYIRRSFPAKHHHHNSAQRTDEPHSSSNGISNGKVPQQMAYPVAYHDGYQQRDKLRSNTNYNSSDSRQHCSGRLIPLLTGSPAQLRPIRPITCPIGGDLKMVRLWTA